MFTDMVDYSALAQRDQALALELLEEYRQIARSLFPRFNGTEIKTIGDAKRLSQKQRPQPFKP
jgi:class 3 adenylate cyclase